MRVPSVDPKRDKLIRHFEKKLAYFQGLTSHRREEEAADETADETADDTAEPGLGAPNTKSDGGFGSILWTRKGGDNSMLGRRSASRFSGVVTGDVNGDAGGVNGGISARNNDDDDDDDDDDDAEGVRKAEEAEEEKHGDEGPEGVRKAEEAEEEEEGMAFVDGTSTISAVTVVVVPVGTCNVSSGRLWRILYAMRTARYRFISLVCMARTTVSVSTLKDVTKADACDA